MANKTTTDEAAAEPTVAEQLAKQKAIQTADLPTQRAAQATGTGPALERSAELIEPEVATAPADPSPMVITPTSTSMVIGATPTTDAAQPLPESSAIANPAPATTLDSGSGAFVEGEIAGAIPVDHPAIDNNPRAGTTAVQNGQDFNDPRATKPDDPDFAGQGLDLTAYGTPSAT